MNLLKNSKLFEPVPQKTFVPLQATKIPTFQPFRGRKLGERQNLLAKS